MANGKNSFVGDANAWHIHHNDHIKYHNGARVNVSGRTQTQVLEKLREKYPNLDDLTDKSGWSACKTWMDNNLGD
ncbi:hypothetical protein [Pseudoalteromonas xiamenensis]